MLDPHIDYHEVFSCSWSIHKFFLDLAFHELLKILKNNASPEYPID